MTASSLPFPRTSTRVTDTKYICASEKVKLIGSINARFPDFGHHLEKEMGGLWLHPIKLLDGFWMRLTDKSVENVDVWLIADQYEIHPWGNTFNYNSNLGHTALTITQRQFCPEKAAGLIVEYDIHNKGDFAHDINLEWLARTDMRPVWFSDTENLTSGGQDTGEWLASENLFLVKDPVHDWYTSIGSFPSPQKKQIGQHFGPEITTGDGLSLSMFYSLSVQPDQHEILRFYIAGSFTSQADCLQQHRLLTTDTDYIAEKQKRYVKLLENTKIQTPDTSFNEICDWVKINTDWLIMDCGSFGRGLSAGAPEYIWWFGCDNCYALQGVLAMGDFKLVHDTLLLLLRYSEKHNGNGRIIHEVNTAGICANPGNTQETAHFIVMLWIYYEWTGDFSLIEKAFPYLEKSVQWLQAQDPENEYFPGGYGIIEISGLNSKMIDTAVYAAEAYRSYSLICEFLNKMEDARKYIEIARKTKDAINSLLWDDKEELYCDAYTNVDEVLEKKAAIIAKRHYKNGEKAEEILNHVISEKQKTENGKSGWLLNHNWIINTPMEMGLAPVDKAEKALAKLHTENYIGPYGMYLSGIYRDSTMTISTGAMAVAQVRYGHADRALDLLQRMFQSFGMSSPGCIAEMSPDYGCFVQAWTAYAVFIPIVRYFFGVQPEVLANQHRLILCPCMPAQWDHANLNKALVLDGELEISFVRKENRLIYSGSFSGTTPLLFALAPNHSASINGTEYRSQNEELLIELNSGGYEIFQY